MKVFDFNRIAINDYPYTYLLEVAFRSVFTFSWPIFSCAGWGDVASSK